MDIVIGVIGLILFLITYARIGRIAKNTKDLVIHLQKAFPVELKPISQFEENVQKVKEDAQIK